MSKSVAFLGAVAMLAVSALPAAAADYYGGDDGPLAYRGQDYADFDGGRGRIGHRHDLLPDGRAFAGPGPVVFDERGAGPRFEGPGYGGPAWHRPAPPYGYGRPPGFPPRGEGFGGYGGYRPAAVAVGPAYGEGEGGPDEGCTMERARSVTPAGWEKTVTRRTCYRR